MGFEPSQRLNMTYSLIAFHIGKASRGHMGMGLSALKPIMHVSSKSILPALLALASTVSNSPPAASQVTVSTNVEVEIAQPVAGPPFSPQTSVEAPNWDETKRFKDDPDFSAGTEAAPKTGRHQVTVEATSVPSVPGVPESRGTPIGDAAGEAAAVARVPAAPVALATAEAEGKTIAQTATGGTTPPLSVLPRGGSAAELAAAHGGDAAGVERGVRDQGSDPVNPATGEFLVDKTDVELSGVGLPFRMRRVYRNRWTYDGPMGFNWTHAYDQRLVFSQAACNRTAHWLTGEGSMIRFDETATGAWVSSPPAPHRLAAASDGTFVITAPDGVRSTYRADGTLKEIRDLNDNVLAFTWGAVPGVAAGGPPRLLTATDTVNRTIQFVYGGDGYLDRVEVPSAGITAMYTVDGNKDLTRVVGAGGIAESYEYQNGFAAASLSYLPTSELQGACEAACGTDPATCHGPSPCDQAAEELQEACVAECFDPAECQKGCSACKIQCETHPEGHACRAGCIPGCESNCRLLADVNCIHTMWTVVVPECADQCLEVCRDFCDPTLVCERWGGSTLTPCSTGPTCVEDVCVGTNRSSGGRSTTAGGNTYATCDKIIDSWDQDGPHSGGVCIGPFSLGWCCKKAAYDCCLKGANCPGGCNKNVKCLDRCAETFLNGSPGTSSCRPTRSPGCRFDARRACPGACASACAQSCGKACTDNCNTACVASCNDRGFCQRECGKQPRAATCKRSCVAECVAKNTHPSGKTVFGLPEESNHNLLRVKDATGAVYVENVYQEDVFSSGFDRVGLHIFGGDRITFQHYNLVTPGAPLITAADQPFLSATREFTSVCPKQCLVDVGPPNRWTEGWVAVSPGEYVVLISPDGGDPAPEGWPVTAGPKFEDPRTLGAYAWYELRRTAATTGMLWPPVKLPAEGLAIHTPEGTLTLRASRDRPGQVAFSRLRADEHSAVLGTAGYPTALLTLVRTPAGFRAYRGRAVGAAAVFPAGACTPELEVQTTVGGPKLAAGTCKGTASFRELARRPGRAGEPVWSGQLTDPRGPIFWSFNEGTGVRSDSSPSGDPWRPNPKDPWRGLCEPPSRIPADPACTAARLAMKGIGGPPVPHPDCGAPWGTRGAASTTGYTPEPGAEDLSMGCVGGGVEVPPLPPDTCPVEAYVHPVTGPTAERHQPIARASVVRDAAGAVWTYHSSAKDQLLRVVNNTSGARTHRNFDLLGRLTGERSPFGDRSCVTYDDAWNPVRVVSLPAPGRYAPTPQIERRTSFAAHGRPEVLFDPNQPGLPLLTFHYDAKMNVTAIEPAAPAPAISFHRDGRGRVDQITHPDGTHTAVVYKPSNGVVETMTFDEGGALATTHTFGSNALGQITDVSEPGHATRGFTWHKDGRIESEWITLVAGATPLTTTNLSDPFTGRLTTERGPVVTRIYSYHGRGLFQTVTEQPTPGGSPSRVTCLDYDGDGGPRLPSRQGARRRSDSDQGCGRRQGARRRNDSGQGCGRRRGVRRRPVG